MTLHDFERQLADSWPSSQWQDVSVLVAVSGGADSIALLRGLHQRKTEGPGRLAVAHVNHHLRGAQSEEDARFVRRLCKQLALPCHIGEAPVSADDSCGGEGLEAIARHARYALLRDVAQRVGARYVVTAHTADDQAETILHRIVRGTGVAGLTGIPRARRLGEAVTLLRPMLAVRRDVVLDYLDGLGQSYRDDASNKDRRFARNRIRHDLIPLLARDYNKDVIDALLRLGHLAGEARTIVEDQVDRLRAIAAREARGAFILNGRQLADCPEPLVRELLIACWQAQGWPLQAMTFEHWKQLAAMVPREVASLSTPSDQSVGGIDSRGLDEPMDRPCGDAVKLPETKKRMFPGTVTAFVSRGCLHVTRRGDLLSGGRES